MAFDFPGARGRVFGLDGTMTPGRPRAMSFALYAQIGLGSAVVTTAIRALLTGNDLTIFNQILTEAGNGGGTLIDKGANIEALMQGYDSMQ